MNRRNESSPHTEVTVHSVETPSLQGQTLLAIDTAIGTSVALGHEGRIFEAFLTDTMRHVEVVGELIARVLVESGVAANSITGVVCGIGPGPFTGLRVGIAAAQAFALGAQAPLLPVVSHEAVALERFAAHAGPVRVVQDAKRRELFVSVYEPGDARGGIPTLTTPPHIVARDAFAENPADVWPDRIPATWLVRAAQRRIEAGAGFEYAEALYLRQPDVAAPGQVKRVSS